MNAFRQLYEWAEKSLWNSLTKKLSSFLFLFLIDVVYLGIYPAAAGHDYQSIAAKNFAHVVVARAGQPTLVRRSDYRPASSL